MHNWKDLDTLDIKSFIAILFLMGINVRSNMDDHWNTNPMLISSVLKYISKN